MQLRSSAWQNVDATAEPLMFVDYLDAFDQAMRAARLASLVPLALGPGGAALDVGCGPGEVLIDLAGLVAPGGRVVGVDVSETMLATARSRAAARGVDVELRHGDAHMLEFGDGSFDAVHCDRVLQHLDDPRSAVTEMARVLVPGGRLMLKEPDWDGLFIDADDVATTRVVRDSLVAGIRHPFIGRRLRRLALGAGLEVVDFGGTLGVYAVSRDAADRMWCLHAQLDRARDRAVIERRAAQAWWDELGALDAAGRFFAGMTSFRLVARKPSAMGGTGG